MMGIGKLSEPGFMEFMGFLGLKHYNIRLPRKKENLLLQKISVEIHLIRQIRVPFSMTDTYKNTFELLVEYIGSQIRNPINSKNPKNPGSDYLIYFIIGGSLGNIAASRRRFLSSAFQR